MNLTNNGIFFFLIVIFLVIIVILLSVVLLKKNKKLKKMVEKEEIKVKEDIPIVDTNVKKEVLDEEPIDIFKIDDTKKEEVFSTPKEVKTEEEIFFTPKEVKIEIEERPKVEIKEDVKSEKVVVDKPKIEISTPRAYQRNVLREMSRKMPTSPIHIDRSDYDDEGVYTVTSKIDNEIDRIDLREDNSSPLENMKDVYETNDSMRIASEIVSRMEEEIKPSNIELTEYERKQEEEAIISYDELQKVKDRIYNLTEEEETDEFIDELKDFRLDLR